MIAMIWTWLWGPDEYLGWNWVGCFVVLVAFLVMYRLALRSADQKVLRPMTREYIGPATVNPDSKESP